MSKQNFDTITRASLWNVHKNTCFYCTKPLDWFSLHIDHIIPEYYLDHMEKFSELRLDFGLAEAFDINGYANLVPCHSKCNQRKGKQLFAKNTTLYYLGLAEGKIKAVEKEIERSQTRKNKGKLLAWLKTALETELLDDKEVSAIIEKARFRNFSTQEIKLTSGFEFIDAIYDSFYLDQDCHLLYDKPLLTGGVELINDDLELFHAVTVRQWQNALAKGFYPKDNSEAKRASEFISLEGFLKALHQARMPKYSFVSEPWINLTDLDSLCPSLLIGGSESLKQYIVAGKSIGDLIREGIVKKKNSGIYQISLEFDGIETSFSEQFRADFNGDGFEDIFVSGWFRAVGGTLGSGFTSILSRSSKRELLRSVDVGDSSSTTDFNITLWQDFNAGSTLYCLMNGGDEPIMDAVLYVDKLGKTKEEQLRSRHSMDIVFGTVPPGQTLKHAVPTNENDMFGFPLLSAEFTSKDGVHYRVDERNNVTVIKFRASFD